MDASGFGMGQRSKRYAMIVKDGKVTELLVEPAGGLNVSSAESVLEALTGIDPPPGRRAVGANGQDGFGQTR